MDIYNGFTDKERRTSYEVLKKLRKEGKVENWEERPCSICGQSEGLIMAHQEEYDRPAEHYPVCVECHMKLHARFKFPTLWLKHLEHVSKGGKSNIYKTVIAYFGKSKKATKHFSEMEEKRPSDFGNEWFHKLKLTPIDINPKNK